MRPLLLISTFLLYISGGLVHKAQAQLGNEFLGHSAGASITSGDYNTFVGDSSGKRATSGFYNTFVGERSGANVTSSSDNTFIGHEAGYLNKTGVDNTFVGKEAGYHNTVTDNTFIGTEAGRKNTTGADNTFIGEEAGENNTTGDDNTFVGQDAGHGSFNGSITGDDNTFIGNSAGYSIQTGHRNTSLGNEALYDVNSGYRNTAVGDSAGIDVGAGFYNTFLGQAAGAATEHADYNTFVGARAGWDNNRTNNPANANRNTYIGFTSGSVNREGIDNVGMGAYSNFDNTNRSRCTFIGANSIAGINDATLVGFNSRVEGRYASTFGINSEAWGLSSITIGYNSKTQVGSDSSLAIGAYSNVYGKNNMALGSSATIPNLGLKHAFAIGSGATVITSNTCVIGSANNNKRMTLGINTDSVNSKASLHLGENNKGLLINSFSTEQRIKFGESLSLKDIGMMVFDNEEVAVYIWSGKNWKGSGAQDLHLSDNILSIDNSTKTIDLSPFKDNTDAQTLALKNNELSISGGNSVDLSKILSNVYLRLDELEAKVSQQDEAIDILQADIALLKTFHTTPPPANILEKSESKATLYQSMPNPTNGAARINYFVPPSTIRAQLLIFDLNGKLYKEVDVEPNGMGFIDIEEGELVTGQYYYTLLADGRKVATLKMIVL